MRQSGAAQRRHDPARLIASNERARELLGWTPRIDLREGLRRTYEASRSSTPLVTQLAGVGFGAITLLFDFQAQVMRFVI